MKRASGSRLSPAIRLFWRCLAVFIVFAQVAAAAEPCPDRISCGQGALHARAHAIDRHHGSSPEFCPSQFVQASGLRVDVQEMDDMSPIRDRYGVSSALASCHTAVVSGYAIEGHVPAADILRLLKERSKITGLAVPGMVPGSPGLDQGPPQHFATLAFDERGYRVFAQH
jgi:hypothetical protein